jgi:murein DD-endopeptidase MepM/ murein hydrolase activator NlpD
MVWFLDIEKNMRNGDVVHLVYEVLDSEDRFKVLKLTYQSGYASKTFEANYYRKSENDYGAYYDKEGKEIAGRIASSTTPIKNYMEITSLPGDSRGSQGGHSGTDFKAEVGTPVYASFDGRVTRVNWNTRVNGYCVELDHPREGVKTLYLHLSKVTAKRGGYVKKGQQIALSGNTGRTSAPHLHYEIKGRGKRKRIYNPFSFKHISTLNRQIPAEEWEKFSRTLHQYNQILKAS